MFNVLNSSLMWHSLYGKQQFVVNFHKERRICFTSTIILKSWRKIQKQKRNSFYLKLKDVCFKNIV